MVTISFSDETSALQSAVVKEEGYRQFKTPFYNIEIALGAEGEYRKLPVEVAKLIQKVEITEVIKQCSQNVVVIDLVEGSREGTEDNSPGFVTDLQFTSDGGFSFIPSELVGLAEDLIDDIVGSRIIIGQDTSGEITVDEDPPLENKTPQGFVFSPRNKVKITWGYLEDNVVRRQFVATIETVTTNFPENGQPTTKIVCRGGTSEFLQYTPKTAINFFNNNTTSNALFSSLGISGEAEDITIAELLLKFKDEFGFEVIGNLSKFDDSGKLETGHGKIWAPGKSLFQFFTELAETVKAYFTVKYNPNTDLPVIIFIPQEEFEKTSIITDRKLMTYKGPGSILKSVNIAAIYDRKTGSTQVGYDDTGKKVIASSGNGAEKQQLFEGAKITDTNSLSGKTASTVGKNMSKIGDLTGKAGYTVSANKPAKVKSDVINSAVKCSPITLEFTALGYTKFRPGPCPFFGLGARLSGYYTIQNITHELTSKGYTVRGSAMGTGDGNEGLIGGNVIQESETGKSESVGLFEALGSVSN